MLCGVAPIPASSGKTRRHRLNRGADRQANAAIYRVVLSRMRWDLRTQAYVQRRTTEGLSKKEIIRCLKRLIARELYYVLRQSLAPTAAILAEKGPFPDPGHPVGELEGVNVEHAQRSEHERR